MTAEAYTSYEAQAIQAAITMLSGSSTFRTLVGAADAAAALASIIEHDGGSPLDNGADGIAKSCNGTSITLASASFALLVQGEIDADADQAYGWQRLSGKSMSGSTSRPSPAWRSRNAPAAPGISPERSARRCALRSDPPAAWPSVRSQRAPCLYRMTSARKPAASRPTSP